MRGEANLRDQSATIEIRGLGEGAGKAPNFPIEELYIPLTTAAGADFQAHAHAARRPVGPEEALTHRRLVIVGDPGSGKTAFLRRIAFCDDQSRAGTHDAARAAGNSNGQF